MISADGLYKKTADLSEFSINSTYIRFNFRTNVDLNLSKNLSIGVTIGGTVEDKANPAGNNTSTIFNSMSSIPPNSFPVYTESDVLSSNLLYFNPWGDILQTGFYTSNGRILQSTFDIREKLDFLTKGLSAAFRVSFNSSFTSLSNKSRNYLRLGMSRNGEGETVYTPIGQNTSLSGSEGESNQWRSYSIQSFLNYNRSFGCTTVDGVMMFNSSNYAYTLGGVPYRGSGTIWPLYIY